jgi:hypothetical protein
VVVVGMMDACSGSLGGVGIGESFSISETGSVSITACASSRSECGVGTGRSAWDSTSVSMGVSRRWFGVGDIDGVVVNGVEKFVGGFGMGAV